MRNQKIRKGVQGYRRTDISSKEIISMLEEGKGAADIAAKLECSVELVRYRANRGGWKFKAGGNRERRKQRTNKWQQENVKTKRCACCNKIFIPNRPNRDGIRLKMLCFNCFKHGSQEETYSIHAKRSC